MYSLPQKLAAEFLGSSLLVLFAAGAVCADHLLRTSNQAGLGPAGMALAYGLTWGALVTAAAHISGGHFNPAVTVGLWTTRRLDTLEAVSYCVAQLAGSVTGAYLLRSALPENIWRAAALGTPALADGVTRGPAMLIEGATAFLLVFVLISTTLDPYGVIRGFSGVAVGFAATAGALWSGPLTGAAMNPARALGPALASSNWADHGVYWIGPLAGGILAAWVYGAIFLPRRSRSV